MDHQINITPDGKELIIRNGQAAELLPPYKGSDFTIQPRSIPTALDFYKWDPEKTFISVDLTHSIRYDVNAVPTHRIGMYTALNEFNADPKIVMRGEICPSEQYTQFTGYLNRQRTTKETLSIIREMKAMFVNVNDYQTLVNTLKYAKVSQDRTVLEINDGRGNKNIGTQTNANNDIMQRFQLELEFVAGEPKAVVDVDVCYDISNDGRIQFWFECWDLETELLAEMYRIKDEVCSKLTELGFTVIYR